VDDPELLTDYRGRSLRLTAERLGHILGHPELAGMEEQIAAALGSPAQVMQSISDPDAALYYLPQADTPFGDKWLCVVVKYEADGGFVLTAYLTDKVKKGTQLWPAK
jgi:hypothetical protein